MENALSDGGLDKDRTFTAQDRGIDMLVLASYTSNYDYTYINEWKIPPSTKMQLSSHKDRRGGETWETIKQQPPEAKLADINIGQKNSGKEWGNIHRTGWNRRRECERDTYGQAQELKYTDDNHTHGVCCVHESSSETPSGLPFLRRVIRGKRKKYFFPRTSIPSPKFLSRRRIWLPWTV